MIVDLEVSAEPCRLKLVGWLSQFYLMFSVSLEPRQLNGNQLGRIDETSVVTGFLQFEVEGHEEGQAFAATEASSPPRLATTDAAFLDDAD